MQPYWFKKSELETGSSVSEASNVAANPGKKLCCRLCKFHITDSDQAISIDDAHTHTFTNPAGYTYTINCFQSAPGCLVIGDCTSEHTWFSGYRWQIAICQSCHEQLGWLFSNDRRFFALIADRLIHIARHDGL